MCYDRDNPHTVQRNSRVYTEATYLYGKRSGAIKDEIFILYKDSINGMFCLVKVPERNCCCSACTLMIVQDAISRLSGFARNDVTDHIQRALVLRLK